MLRHIILVFCALWATTSSAQLKVFEQYDFNQGGYYLLGLGSELAPDSFYVDDIEVLNAIKDEWSFSYSGPEYFCGYHYAIVLCRHGEILQIFKINLERKVFSTDRNHYVFQPEQLFRFKDSFKKPSSRREKFDGVDEARAARSQMLKDSNLIALLPTPQWDKFDGFMLFDYPYVPQNELMRILGELDLHVKAFETAIKDKYPNEPFELYMNKDSDGNHLNGPENCLTIAVKCNKTLGEKLSLPEKGTVNTAWKPYRLLFRSFWVSTP